MTDKKTPLYDLHVKHNAKMVSFAGYDMPIQYEEGIVKEHEWVRSNAGIFDVSHMGQVTLKGQGATQFMEYITPSPFTKTPHGRAKYTVLTNEEGGIIDDLIITRLDDDDFFLVINAGCKEKDIAWIKKNLPDSVQFEELSDRALIALQGPKAQEVLAKITDADIDGQTYMSMQKAKISNGAEIFISRLGYTGEDGFEISVHESDAKDLWNLLLENKLVKEIGLGARDTLRLEMGYPLYGNDIDADTSPIEADLGWVVSKVNDNFIGAKRVIKDRSDGISKKRVGIKLTGKGVARGGAEIYSIDGKKIGDLTSGGFSPSLKESIGQGYVDINFSKVDTDVCIRVRGRDITAKVAQMPFIEPKTKSIKKNNG
ncbi:glycine cleavage system aminomethyltransferase GcvT [Rickettsiales bacterium]|nr:glycine cleavage system aminomethyltransferase GcvT [Rickettsiales bacterium]